MPRWSMLYAGTLMGLAFLAWPNAMHADEYRCRGKKCRYYAAPTYEVQEKKCEGKVRGVGTQWITEEGALEAAKKDFMERVRYDLGESYLDLNNAEDFVSRCGRVSIGKVLDQVTYRCEIIARPCKAIFGKVEGQK
jgi:hypothetical protein